MAVRLEVKMTITVMIVAGAFFGGFTVGALFRQPEINRLKKQVRQLQNNQGELYSTIKEQQRQVDVLKYEYNALQFYQFAKKQDNRKIYKEELLKVYMYKEYVDILYEQLASDKELDKDRNTYFSIMNDFFEDNKKVSEAQMKEAQQYILAKYNKEIMHCKYYDIDESINRIKTLSA
jgi:hypothetical protein